jgi:hypothetical protein
MTGALGDELRHAGLAGPHEPVEKKSPAHVCSGD